MTGRKPTVFYPAWAQSGPRAGAVDGGMGRKTGAFQARGGGDYFEHRTGGVEALCGPIDERASRVGRQGVPSSTIEAPIGQLVGVVPGIGCHGQNFPVVGVQSDNRSLLLP